MNSVQPKEFYFEAVVYTTDDFTGVYITKNNMYAVDQDPMIEISKDFGVTWEPIKVSDLHTTLARFTKIAIVGKTATEALSKCCVAMMKHNEDLAKAMIANGKVINLLKPYI